MEHILLKLVAAHPDTFLAKIDNVPAHWGGGPEIVAAHGDLGTINPKISSIKEPWWHAFEARCKGPGPVRSNLRPKKWVGQ